MVSFQFFVESSPPLIQIIMMKKYVNILFIFFSTFFLCQKITVADTLDKTPIPYAEVIVNGNSYFSDSLGIIQLKHQNETSIRIKKTGYIDKNISSFDSIAYLNPKVIDIREVIIKEKKDIEYNDRYLKQNATNLPNDLTIGFIIEGEKKKIGKIKEISIPIKRIYNNETLLKIDFYDNTDDGISKEPLNTEAIILNVNDLIKKSNNKIDLKDFNIPFDESVLVSLRIIDQTGTTKKKFKDPSIQFYNSKSKGKIYFYNQYSNKWQILSRNLNLISISYVISY